MKKLTQGKTDITARLTGAAVKLLFAWSYSLGFTQLLLPELQLPHLNVASSILGLLFLVFLALMTWQKLNLVLSGSLLFFLSLMILVFRDKFIAYWQVTFPSIIKFFTWANNWLWGIYVEQDEWPELLSLLFFLGIGLAAYLFIARFCRPFLPGLTLVILLAATGNPLTRARFIWFCIAAVPAIAAPARKQRMSWHLLGGKKHKAQADFLLQSLPVAISGLLLASLISLYISPAIFYSSRLEKFVDNTVGIMTSSLGMQRRFSAFSLADAGYYPLLDRLGGPVSLSDEPVMRVEGYVQPMLLRGNMAQDYDGQRWHRPPDNAIYLFDGPMHLQDQISIFNLNLPESDHIENLNQRLQENINYSITPVRRRLQTVFLEGRPLEIYMQEDFRNQFYFNSSGQVLSRYWLTQENTVVVSARKLLIRSRDFSGLVHQIERQIPEEQIKRELSSVSQWLQLPDRAEYHADSELARLAARLTADRRSSLDQALAIRNFLFQSARYELNVKVPPADVDFVTWFLETEEGYCVYFATAMTMLSRLAGIPARYVEGYYAPPATGTDSARIITGEYAHAWTEIYLAGIGWIPIDATPGGITAEPAPEVTPEPDPVATITPVIPTPPSEGRRPDLTPPAPSANGDPDSAGARKTAWQLLIALTIAALAMTVYILIARQKLHKSHDPGHMRIKQKDRSQLAIFYWSQLLHLLKLLRSPWEKHDTVRSWLQKVYARDRWLAGRPQLLAEITDAVEKAYYSLSDPSDKEIASLARAYDIIEMTARQNMNPLKYFWRRFLTIFWHR